MAEQDIFEVYFLYQVYLSGILVLVVKDWYSLMSALNFSQLSRPHR